MKCSEFEQYEMEYMDGNLSADKISELKEHISQCKGCKKEYEIYAEMISGFDKIQELTPEDTFTDNVLTAISALPKPCKGLKFLVLCAVTAAISSLAGVLNLALLNQSELTATLSSSPLTIHFVKLIELLAKANDIFLDFLSHVTLIISSGMDVLVAPLMLLCITALCVYTVFNTNVGGIKK